MAETFADKIKHIRQETGARLVAVGEVHNALSPIQYLRDSLPELKAQGINTLYLEIPTDTQPLMDKALQGNEAAQRDLRIKFEHWFGSHAGTEGAQLRYDMIFDANKTGIRVRCADTESLGDASQRANDLGPDPDMMDARLVVGNPVMARNIKQMDDNKGALLLVGLGHTQKAVDGDETEIVNNQKFKPYKSSFGGVDQRLNDLGIPTASVDFTNKEGNEKFSLEKLKDTPAADYYIHAPYEEYGKSKYNISTGFRMNWQRLADVLEQSAIQAEVSGNKEAVQACRDASGKLSTLPQLLDNLQFLKLDTKAQEQVLSREMKNLNTPLIKAFNLMEGKLELKAAAMYYYPWMVEDPRDDRDATITGIVQDNQDLHLSGASQMWKRDPMPLASEKTSLAKSFDQATTADKVINRPEPLPLPTAPALQTKNYDR